MIQKISCKTCNDTHIVGGYENAAMCPDCTPQEFIDDALLGLKDADDGSWIDAEELHDDSED